MSKIEDQVINKIQSRAEIGESKYGVTMERKDLSLCDWVTHLQEELLDASIYAEKLKEDAKIFTSGSFKSLTNIVGTKETKLALCCLILVNISLGLNFS